MSSSSKEALILDETVDINVVSHSLIGCDIFPNALYSDSRNVIERWNMC
jgi:hypothetical protein